MNKDDTRKAVKQAAIAAFISAGITLLMILFAMQSPTNSALSIYNDPYNFFDVAVLVGLGVGLLRYSRAAAVILFIYFILGKVYISIELGKPANIGITFVFLYFYWKGIRGSFTYHRLRREADPSYHPAPKWSYFLGIPIGILCLAATGFGLMTMVGVFPSIAVMDGDKLPQSDAEFLINEGIVWPHEKVQLFYSTGLISIIDDGNMLTDKRIISYERIDGKLAIYAVRIENVADVIVAQDGEYFSDTIIEIWNIDGDGFSLFLSAEEDGDKRFISEIKKRIAQTDNTASKQ